MNVGDKVTWESQSGGSWKKKTGTIIREIPAGMETKQYIPDSAKKSHIKFDNRTSKVDRVLISVPAGKDGQISHYYCPAKSVLVMQGNV